MSSPDFKLMFPGGYPPSCKIEGGSSFEGTIHAPSLREPFECWRSTLPPNLEELVFCFGETPPPYPQVQVHCFYHLGEFFVVSEQVRDFLLSRTNCEFEMARIATRHPRGESTGPYWAMKVKTVIDCIDPDRSVAADYSVTGTTVRPFSELVIEMDLPPQHAPWFSTLGRDKYREYPDRGLKNVFIDLSVVPADIKIFQPKYWPQFLLIEAAFAGELDRLPGSRTDYNFWTLPLKEPHREWASNMLSLR
jgi:hypothetical protein